VMSDHWFPATQTAGGPSGEGIALDYRTLGSR
jgi:hypothetical protein